jgi:two-component system response regulator FlrC
MINRVLIIEDDSHLREAISDTLELSGYQSMMAGNGEEGLKIAAAEHPSLIISDVQMPGLDGHAVLKKLRKQSPEIPVILITAHANVTQAVAAMRGGAVDYLPKPFVPEVLIEKVKKYLPTEVYCKNRPIAGDEKSKNLLNLATKVAASEATVLISGESGTGKEVLARFIHDNSPRAKQVFVAINCAAIPETMLEATLFGYEKGAFTGAVKSMPGKFEQAQDGTLLLDEISEMNLSLQAKLLRVLQESEVERIGGTKPIALNVRIIATTNRNLLEEVKNHKFREDLYYRLNVFPLRWMPLRERPNDIIPLAENFLQKYSQKMQIVAPHFSEDAIEKLVTYDWPGNAREMDNVIQRALILYTNECIEAADLSLDMATTTDARVEEDLFSEIKEHEYKIIEKVMKKHQGQKKLVAEELGLSDRTLRYKLAKMRKLHPIESNVE